MTLLIHPRGCHSTGNDFSFLFEAFSYGIINGVAVGVMGHRHPDCLANSPENLDAVRLFWSFPRLMIPKVHVSVSKDALNGTKCETNPSVASWPATCSLIPQWPSESQDAFLWKHLGIHSTVTNIAFSRLFASDTSYSEIAVHVSVAIHFRCSDNLGHHSYGVIPFRNYTNILKSIYEQAGQPIRKVTLYTDSNSRRANFNLCSRLTDELRRLIHEQPGYVSSDIFMEHSSVSHTLQHIHSAMYVITGVSTFSFFASLGAPHVYVPKVEGSSLAFPAGAFSTLSNFVVFPSMNLRPGNLSIDDFLLMVKNA